MWFLRHASGQTERQADTSTDREKDIQTVVAIPCTPTGGKVKIKQAHMYNTQAGRQ